LICPILGLLKPSYSRGSFCLKKIQSGQSLPSFDIEPNNPWIAQKWMNGNKYCSYAICRNGRLQAHVVYPNRASGAGYCMSFESIDHPKILEWVQTLVRDLNLTGQISFDFVESQDGQLYALECNPRATSGLHLLTSNPNLSDYFLKDNPNTFEPPLGIGSQLAFGMMLYGLKQREENQSLSNFIKKHLQIPDVTFSKKDLKPFLFQLYIFAHHIIQCLKYKLPVPEAFLHDLNWEEETIL